MANAFGCYPKVPGSNPGPRASVVRGVKMPPMSTMVYAPGTLWVTKVETLEDGTQAVTAVDLSGTIELKFKFDQRASLEEAVPHPGQHIRLSEFSYSGDSGVYWNKEAFNEAVNERLNRTGLTPPQGIWSLDSLEDKTFKPFPDFLWKG
jgi:hypothetical protein